MILVTGATGNVGREVVNLLVSSGEKVVALTRHPEKAALPDGAHIVGGDPSHPQTLTKALRDIKAILISPRALGDATAGAATAELLKLAAEQGTPRVVVLSAATVEYGGGYQRFADGFRAVEDAARASGLPWTFLRSTDYASNSLAWVPQIRANGIVRGAYGDGATPTIHERDIAAVSARALRDAAHAGHIYVLTGPQSLSQRDKVRLIGEAIGREVFWEEIAPAQVRQVMLAQGLPQDVPDRLLGTGPALSRSQRRDRLRPLWSRFWGVPRSPSPSGPPSTPPPSETDRKAIMTVDHRAHVKSRERRTVMTQPSTRILVLGAGIAGLLFTLRLAGKVGRSSVQITLVDEADTFTVRPRLHEFATGQRIFSRPFAQILRKTQVQFLQGRVTSLDPGQHRVTVQDQQQQHELEYDYLIYALGSLTDRQNAPGVEQYAYSLSARGPFSAAALRDRLPEIGARGGQVVVCGGGVTGIETAAQVASVYPRIKVSLVTRGSLAFSWDKRVADIFRRRLVSLGVEIVDQSEVSAVRAQSVVLERGRELACDLCIWTGGFVVSPLAREAGLAVNERDQVLVDPFLHSVSHQEIYAIGDAALPAENPGVSHVRMSAFTASIMGAHGADCLRAELAGKTPKPLSFAYAAQAIALGQHYAIFFPLSPDDKAIPPYITGRLGALTREFFIGFVIIATLAQQRFPAMFAWLGKGRYEQQLQKRALEEHPAQQVHHLS